MTGDLAKFPNPRIKVMAVIIWRLTISTTKILTQGATHRCILPIDRWPIPSILSTIILGSNRFRISSNSSSREPSHLQAVLLHKMGRTATRIHTEWHQCHKCIRMMEIEECTSMKSSSSNKFNIITTITTPISRKWEEEDNQKIKCLEFLMEMIERTRFSLDNWCFNDD